MKPPWRTLRGRLALGSISGVVAASIAFTILGVQLVRAQTLNAELEELEASVRGIATLISEDVAREIPEKGKYSPSADRVEAFEAIVGTGTELAYSGPDLAPDPRGEPSALQRRTIDKIDYSVLERDGVQRFNDTIPETGKEVIAAAAPITLDGETVGSAVVLRERGAFGTIWRDIANRVVIAALIGLAFALLATVMLTRQMFLPLSRLQKLAGDVGRGNLDAQVHVSGPDEVQELATAFNAMVRELKHRDVLTRDFLMRVTHDLRTPLTAIRGHTQALADGVVPEDQVPRSLTAIEGESARLEALVTDLLDLAKLEARRFRLDLDEIDGDELVQRAFDAYAGEAVRRNMRYGRSWTDLPRIYTDAARVQQIVGNLLDNAFRWTPDGGSIQMTAARRAGGGLTLSVSDEGPGIPAETLEEIFEPFRSENTPDGQHGSGLGLAISRQLARALGGDLTVESTVGRGSRFTLNLPAETRQRSVLR